MISIVIPAFNEEKYIGDCLEALAKQTTQEPYEVLVVNNASTDDTEQIVKTFASQLQLRIIDEPQKGRGAARARGFREARGEIILSTDADTVVPSNWIEKQLAYFKEPQVVAVTGACFITEKGQLTNVFFNWWQPQVMRLYRLCFGHFWLSGFNFGIRRDVYKKSGGFNPKLNTHEDIDLGFKVMRLGKIAYMSDVSVKVSARRYTKGIILGGLPYLTFFVEYYFLKRKTMVLTDAR